MKYGIAAATLVVCLIGCATTSSPVPAGYTGPTATIKDSIRVISDTKAEFFVLYELDGRHVENALGITIDRNAGNGFLLTPSGADRLVPAQAAAFHILGRTHFGAPIDEMVSTAYLIDGEVRFAPVAGEGYVVKGELGADHSAVWVENEKTGAQIGNKLLIKGSAAVGMFKKRPPVEQVPPAL